jgi:hypothetical protein
VPVRLPRPAQRWHGGHVSRARLISPVPVTSRRCGAATLFSNHGGDFTVTAGAPTLGSTTWRASVRRHRRRLLLRRSHRSFCSSGTSASQGGAGSFVAARDPPRWRFVNPTATTCPRLVHGLNHVARPAAAAPRVRRSRSGAEVALSAASRAGRRHLLPDPPAGRPMTQRPSTRPRNATPRAWGRWRHEPCSSAGDAAVAVAAT